MDPLSLPPAKNRPVYLCLQRRINERRGFGTRYGTHCVRWVNNDSMIIDDMTYTLSILRNVIQGSSLYGPDQLYYCQYVVLVYALAVA